MNLDRRDWWWPVVAVVVLVVSAALAARHELLAGEASVFRLVNGLPGFLEGPAGVVMTFGTVPAVVALAVVAGLVTRRVWPGLAVLGAGLLARVTAPLLKDAVDRGRPAALLDDVHVREHPGGPGYPSAHTSIAFAVAVVLACCFPRIRWPVLGGALLVGVARMYMGVHLPLDVLGGAALGILVATPFVAGLLLLAARTDQGSLT